MIDLYFVTPVSVFQYKNVISLVVPGSVGQVGILPGHKNMIIGLVFGVVIVETNNFIEKFFISDGFIKILNNKCTIVIDRIKQFSPSLSDLLTSELDALALISSKDSDEKKEWHDNCNKSTIDFLKKILAEIDSKKILNEKIENFN